MRSAQSRLGVLTSLDSARRGVGRCAEALPVSARSFKLGAATLGGVLGALVLRGLLPGRRKSRPLPPPPAPPALPRSPRLGQQLLSQSVVLLLLPLCRHYLLGENTPVSARLVPLINRLFKKKTQASQSSSI